jgi:hypothetical protein
MRYCAEGQVSLHSVSVQVDGRSGNVHMRRIEFRTLAKDRPRKRKRLQVDFISGISELVAVGRLKEDVTRRASVEVKGGRFQAIAAVVADQQDGDSARLEAVPIAVEAVVAAAASQVNQSGVQQQPMILTGAGAEEPMRSSCSGNLQRPRMAPKEEKRAHRFGVHCSA